MFLLASLAVLALVCGVGSSAGANVTDTGERVAVAVAKKDVVGEYCVGLVGEVGVDGAAAESAFEDLMAEEVDEVDVLVLLLLLLPEDMIL